MIEPPGNEYRRRFQVKRISSVFLLLSISNNLKTGVKYSNMVKEK